MAATATATRAGSRSRYSRIWAAAKAVGLTSDEVHALIDREYRKESLKDLTDRQVEQFGNLLWDMSSGRQPVPRSSGKRTDEGGRADNVNQRRKIFKLAQVIGWNEDSINRFCYSEYGVSRHEWLPSKECSDMIEAMKAIGRREGKLK